MADRTATFAGQIEISRLVITSIITGNKIDVTNLMVELNIYENLFSNYLTGTITITDSIDLINYIPLVGEEKLEISYKTPGMKDSDALVDNMFYIYKVANRILMKENSQMYVIHFMSEEGFSDQHVKVAKAYKGNYAVMAKSLFGDEDALGASDKQVSKFNVEETANAFQFVAPTWSPMKCLNWLAARSISKHARAANYVFYQDMFKYNFVSINSLIAKPASMKFYNSTMNIKQLRELHKTEDLTQYNILRNMTNDLVFDVSTRMAGGMYASRGIFCDLLSKTINIQEYDYIGKFKETNHLNEFPMNSSRFLRNPGSCVVTYINHSSMYDEFQSDDPETWLLQRRSLVQQIGSYVSEITVAGRSDYKVGMTIELETNTVRNHPTSEDAVEKMHKGKFLVVGAHHRISKNEAETILRICKESLIINLK